MSRPLPNAVQKFYNTSGVLLAGGKLYSFAAGTSTPLATYTNQGAGTPNANPTILDSNGHASIWITNAGYKFQLQDSAGNVIWTIDNVYLIEPNSITAQQIAPGAVGTTQLDVNPIGTTQIAIGAITTALLATGAVTTAKFAVGAVTFIKLDPAIDMSQLNNMAEVVFQRSDDLSGARILSMPQYPWSAPTQLSSPATLPPAAAADAKWSPDARFLAVGSSSTPFVTIYERTGTTLSKLPNPGTLPTGGVNQVCWSPDGNFLVCAHFTTPFVTIYQRKGLTFTKLTDPVTIPSANAFGASFSPNGNFLVITCTTDGTVTYQVKGTTFTSIPALSSGGATTVSAWSIDSQYVAVTNQHVTGIDIYQRNVVTFSKITDPTNGLVPPNSAGALGLAWSPNNQFFALALSTAPYIAIYQFAGGAFTLLTAPATLPSGSATGIAFSTDGQYLAISFTGSPFLLIYSISGTTFTALANPASLPTGNGFGLGWASSKQFLSVAVDTTPFVNTFKTAGAFPAKATLYSRDFADV